MEKSSHAPKPTHSVTSEKNKPDDDFMRSMYQRNLFLSMALNMSWQLAIVVIVPIVGGYKLDQHFRTSPWWTLAGVVVTIAGVAGVLVRVAAEANRRVNSGKDKR